MEYSEEGEETRKLRTSVDGPERVRGGFGEKNLDWEDPGRRERYFYVQGFYIEVKEQYVCPLRNNPKVDMPNFPYIK